MEIKEITLYIADDGTEFENELECMDYEMKQRMGDVNYDDVIYAWDEDYNLLSIKDYENSEGGLESFFNNVFYVIGTDEVIMRHLFKDIAEDWYGIDLYPIDGLKCNVRYYYDRYDYTFKDFDEKYGALIDWDKNFRIPNKKRGH